MLVFADTSFFIACVRPKDPHAVSAKRAFEALDHPIIHTSEEVLTEFISFFARDIAKRLPVLEFVDYVLTSLLYRVHLQSTRAFQQSLDFLKERPDKGYSLVDCRSMLIMRQEGIQQVLSSDKHFEQEGFTKLF